MPPRNPTRTAPPEAGRMHPDGWPQIPPPQKGAPAPRPFSQLPPLSQAADYVRRHPPAGPMRIGPLSGDNKGVLATVANLAAQGLGLRTPNGSVRQDYRPRAFTGMKGLAELGRPPGSEALPPRHEYGVEISNLRIDENGEPVGEATQYWRGPSPSPGDDEAHVELKSLNAAHGNHYQNVGPSYPDMRHIDESRRTPGFAGMTVWHPAGMTTFATTRGVLDRMRDVYQDAAGQVAWRDRPLPVRPGEAPYTPGRDIWQFTVDEQGRPLAPEEAQRRALEYTRAHPRPTASGN